MTQTRTYSKAKTLQIRMTESQYAVIHEAARQADLIMSDYARKTILAAVAKERRPGDTEALTAVQNFQRIFLEAMELSLAGKLTVARLRGLVERRSS